MRVLCLPPSKSVLKKRSTIFKASSSDTKRAGNEKNIGIVIADGQSAAISVFQQTLHGIP